MNNIKEENNKIDFIGIGAEKAGTTWIADCLREHPEIYIPKIKELFFFNEYEPHYLKIKNLKYTWGIDWYLNQFKKVNKDKIKGEFSPTYLYCQYAPIRIKKYLKNIKIIVILREPAARLFSQYLNDKKLGLNKKLNLEETIKNNRSYIEKSLYYQHLKNYYNIFNKENLLVLILEEFINNKEKEIKKVFKFLNLKNVNFLPQSLFRHPNKAASPRLFFLNSFMINFEMFLREKKSSTLLKILEKYKIRNLAIKLRELNTAKIKKYPEINPATKKYLKNIFTKDIAKLEKLTNKNLSNWKNI